MKSTQKGFTLIELLIVIAIISLLATTLLPSLQNTRAKGDDARRKVTLKSLQSQIALQTDTGVSGYSNIFSTSGDTKAKLDELVAQTGVAGADYDARSDATSYAVVFPLKADPSKYWCIDASGVSKEVSGRLNTSGTPGCGNIVGTIVGNAPVFTFSYPSPDNCSNDFVYCYYYTGGRGYSIPGILDENILFNSGDAWNSEPPNLYIEDVEDGDLLNSPDSYVRFEQAFYPSGETLVMANTNLPGHDFTSCEDFIIQALYSATDSDSNSTGANRIWYYCQ